MGGDDVECDVVYVIELVVVGYIICGDEFDVCFV